MKEKPRAKGKEAPDQTEKMDGKSRKSKKAKLSASEKSATNPSVSEMLEMDLDKAFQEVDSRGFLERLTEAGEADHLAQLREAVLFSNILAKEYKVPVDTLLFLTGLLIAPRTGEQQEESWRIVLNLLEDQCKESMTAKLLGLDVYGISDFQVAVEGTGEKKLLLDPDVPVRREVFDLVKKAKKLAERVSFSSSPMPAGPISVRHLLAQILWGPSSRAKTHLTKLQYSLGDLKEPFLEQVATMWKDKDLKEAWAEFLNIPQLESPKKSVDDLPKQTSQAVFHESDSAPSTDVIAIEDEVTPRSVLAGYVADSPHEQNDVLGVQQDVRAICAILAARDVPLPLSLGLFGEWGTGKTFFMDRMHERIECLAQASQGKSANETAYCKSILQIGFNPWHYKDANLWASLYTHILDEIQAYLSKDSGEVWENIVRNLEQTKGLYEEAKRSFLEAKNSVTAAEQSLQTVQQAREQREREIEKQFNSLKTLLGVKAQIELRRTAKRFGWEEELLSVGELSRRIRELKSRTGRLRNLFNVMVQSDHAIPYLGFLFLILLLPVGIGVLVPHVTQQTGFLTTAGTFIAQVGALVVGSMAWMRKPLYWLSSGISELEEIRQKVEETRQQKLKTEKVNPDRELAVLREKESAARENLKQAEIRLKEAELDFGEAQPSRRFFRLIEERTASDDHRGRLGLINLIRNDLEGLSNMVNPGLSQYNGRGIAVGSSAHTSFPIDRIILYIDDLDRCAPHRAVDILEAIHVLLAFPIFAVVVGSDPRWLRQSLKLRYQHWLLGFPDDRETGPKSSSAYTATPQKFMEKIFQIPFTVSPMDQNGFRELVRDLVKPPQIVSEQIAEEKPADLETRSEPNQGPDGDGEPGVRGRSGAKRPLMDILANVGLRTEVRGQSESEKALIGGKEMKTKTGDPNESGVNERNRDRVAGEYKESVERDELFLELTPATLELNSYEKNFMESLNHLFTTPRSVKRFVNTYRIFRARLTVSSGDSFLGSEKQPGEFRCAMVLLGIMTGFPNLATKAIRVVFEQDDQATWDKLVTNLKAQPPREEDFFSEHMPAGMQELRSEWDRMCEALASLKEGQSLPFRTCTFKKWAPEVARFSFFLVPPKSTL